MAGRLEGKVAIVSGGAGGIGAATVRRFVAEGARVVIGDLYELGGKRLAEELGDATRFHALDVTSAESWSGCVALAEREFGPVTVLVNNAGLLRFGSIVDAPVEDLQLLMDVNVTGVWLGMQAVVPSMQRAGGGSIVNTSSVEGLGGGPSLAAYTTSKFAVRGMTKAAALDLTPFDIRVNSVHPGAIKTPMVASAMDTRKGRRDATEERPEFDDSLSGYVGQLVAMQRMGEPDEIARLMLFLASDDASYCTGGEFVADGGATITSGFGHGR